jgi:hypothetical protein
MYLVRGVAELAVKVNAVARRFFAGSFDRCTVYRVRIPIDVMSFPLLDVAPRFADLLEPSSDAEIRRGFFATPARLATKPFSLPPNLLGFTVTQASFSNFSCPRFRLLRHFPGRI